jgi:diacylglycerol O-acyltransferase / wax synthase
MQHLSSADAAFLHLETPETPMHVGSLMLFDLPAGYAGDFYEDVKAMLTARLHLTSLFTRKLAAMPFDLADPVWIEDDDIDLDYHIRHVTLRKPGSMAQLEALISRLHSTLLDRSRPLWEVVVIEGLQDGPNGKQVAFYSKAHHSGIDGKAGVELARVFYDVTPEVRIVRPPRSKRTQADYQLGVAELLQAAVGNAARQYVKLAKTLPQAAKALNTVRGILRSRRADAKAKPGQRPLNPILAPRTPFNVGITNQRSYSTMSVPLDELKNLGKRVGGTVNTVVMAMCAGALRRFLLERDALPPKPLIAGVPVNLRAADDVNAANQNTAITVDLATDLADAAARFAAIHASSEAAKHVVSTLKPVLTFDLPTLGSPWLVSGLAMLYGRSNMARRLPPFVNVAISNVPGLPMPLYMVGARMRHYFPVSIPYHGVGLNITVQSYAGQMEFGLTACRRVLTQAESQELIGLLKKALDEIRALPDAPAPPAEVAAPTATVAVQPMAAKTPRKRTGSAKKPATARPALAVVARNEPSKKATRRTAAA